MPLAILAALALATGQSARTWQPQSSGVTARLRGLTAASDTVAWASGLNGTILHTTNGGQTWTRQSIPGTEQLDFRDIDAVDERTAYVLSIGPGAASRIYKTSDGGVSWHLQFANGDPKAFFDAMSFWDAEHGLAVSDSVDGRFVVIRTENGSDWTRIPPSAFPPALPNEGAFAGSGTNIAVLPGGRAWIGTGASTRARVLRTSDWGQTWSVADTPLAASASAGIFSVAFRDSRNGIAVGGDYRQESLATGTGALTSDGGATWTSMSGLSGFRSAVVTIPRVGRPLYIATGPSGTDMGDGRLWTTIEGHGFHALACSPSHRLCWGAGEYGRIGKLTID
jgi:photosystem II stability/assembly factor-like uncharacterized protein